MKPTRAVGNVLLDALDSPALQRIQQHARRVRLARTRTLLEAGQRIEHVWFPTSGVVSLSSTTIEGNSVEVAAIGSEGLVGAAVGLGGRTALCRTVVQVDGEAICVDRASFVRALVAVPQLTTSVQAYVRVLLAQFVQSGVCNRFHTAEQRLSRWLLETADRARSRSLMLTHESLANMLGMRRPWVTVVVRRLRERGCIRYRRGELVVTDRQCLEGATCECYWTLREQLRSSQRSDESTNRRPFT